MKKEGVKGGWRMESLLGFICICFRIIEERGRIYCNKGWEGDLSSVFQRF